MSDFKSFRKSAKAFFVDGRGYYIVLVLCVAVIGFSVYAMLSNRGTDVEETEGGNVLEQPVVVTPPVMEQPVIQDEEPADVQQEGDSQSLETATDTVETGAEPKQETTVTPSAQFIWPVFGEIDMPYSVAALVYNEKLGDWRTHDGVDLSVPIGTQVLACGAGRVVSVEMDPVDGTTVVIEHSGGLKSIYSNLAALPTVSVGDNVMNGEVIGAVGATALGERAENTHLCFRMTLDGQSVDPADYLPPR